MITCTKLKITLWPWHHVLKCYVFSAAHSILGVGTTDSSLQYQTVMVGEQCFRRGSRSQCDWPQLLQSLTNPYKHSYYVLKLIQPNPTLLPCTHKSAAGLKPQKNIKTVLPLPMHNTFLNIFPVPWVAEVVPIALFWLTTSNAQTKEVTVQ